MAAQMRATALLGIVEATHRYDRLGKTCQNAVGLGDEIEVKSAAACEALCDAEPKCNSVDTDGLRCWLNSHCEGELDKGGCTKICGYRRIPDSCSSGVDVGYDYFGNDLSDHSVQDLGSCCQLCTDTEGCSFYSYTPLYGSRCYLKTSQAGRRGSSNFTCGASAAPSPPPSGGAAAWSVDVGSTTPFPHFWEESVGSGHASLTLRPDWRAHLARTRRELGFKRTRFHGILDDDFGISPSESETNFSNLDSLVDFHIGLGMMPLFELSYMPRWLASDPSKTLFYYDAIVSPPKDFAKWGQLIRRTAQHLFDRYGEEVAKTMMFEIWNEPNGEQFWSGTQDQYHLLYREAAQALAAVSQSFQVGGPATNSCNDWIDNLIEYGAENDAKVDFITCHSYGYSGDDSSAGSMGLLDGFRSAKQRAGGRPVAITEWSSSWSHSTPFHDEVGSAPFIVAVMDEAQGVVDHASYWTFSDVFEEGGGVDKNCTVTGGFGLLTLHGTPKPAYRAFQLLHEAGSQRLASTKSQSACPNTGVLALRNESAAQVFVYNRFLAGEAGSPCNVTLSFPSLASLAGGRIARIDEEHCNPKKVWQQMGSPCRVTAEQNVALEAASAIEWRPLREAAAADPASVTVLVPAHGLAVLHLPLDQALV